MPCGCRLSAAKLSAFHDSFAQLPAGPADSGHNWLSYRLMLLLALHGLLRRDWTGGLLARGMLRELCDEPDSRDQATRLLHAIFRCQHALSSNHSCTHSAMLLPAEACLRPGLPP